MIKRKSILNPLIIVLLPISILLNYFSSNFPETVETLYSKGLYKPIGQGLSLITGFFPFSVAEIIVVGIPVLIILYLLFIVKKMFPFEVNKIKLIPRGFLNILILISLIYTLFVFVWGLNYHRQPFAVIAGLETKPASTQELASLCEHLIIRVNELRSIVEEDRSGVMYIKDGVSGVLKRAAKGYDNASNTIPELGGKYGKPKGVFFSESMCYTGISGIYFPFTAEANVNIAIPYSMLPSTTCHEMAHQRGFAREDEANYISYLVCNIHPDIDFKYSGTLLALLHSMNALYRYDSEKYQELQAMYSDGLKSDLNYLRKFWEKYEGPVEKTSTRINNAYLKSNLQEDGIYSYGRMVDLLLAEYRAIK